MIRCSNLLRKENIRRSALHECDWSCQQKDDRCDLRCPPGWTTVPTHFAICRLTELHHFHPAREGSGSLRPFPIYPLYTQTVILSLDKPIADCFLFRPRKRLEKRRKRSHTNVSNASVIRTSRVSQTPLQAPFPTSINGYHAAKKFLSQSPAKRPTFAFADTLAFANRIAHSGLHAETRGVSDGGAISTLGAFCAVRKPCVARG